VIAAGSKSGFNSASNVSIHILLVREDRSQTQKWIFSPLRMLSIPVYLDRSRLRMDRAIGLSIEEIASGWLGGELLFKDGLF
jgi:hypothetical protein